VPRRTGRCRSPLTAARRQRLQQRVGPQKTLRRSRRQRHTPKQSCKGKDRGLRHCSGMTLEPTTQDETACKSDDSTADGIEGHHTGEHERQDDGGCATLPVTLGASEHDCRDAEETCRGEERSAGLREPKPTAEPSPIASQQSHARILGEVDERHPSTSVHDGSERNSFSGCEHACLCSPSRTAPASEQTRVNEPSRLAGGHPMHSHDRRRRNNRKHHFRTLSDEDARLLPSSRRQRREAARPTPDKQPCSGHTEANG
jgi:hypothetical protein